jgi:hypothetical protein
MNNVPNEHTDIFSGVLYLENGGSIYLQSNGLSLNYAVLQCKRPYSLITTMKILTET